MAASVTFLKPGLDKDEKKAERAARVYILTVVYCRPWTREEPDFEAFVECVNRKLEHFLKNEIFECLEVDDPRLAGVRPEIRSEVGLEQNKQLRLHHHVSTSLIYPRIERPKEQAQEKGFNYLLARMRFNATRLNKYIRESYGAEFCEACPLKVHISSGRNDDLFAIREYSEKNKSY